MPQKKPALISENRLLSREGVWYPIEGNNDGFAYTDGDSEEQAIKERILSARDRSTRSQELAGPYNSWALQYHLSPDRANLLRPLRLGHRKRILEVGCGCGAITRHLGEQGNQVDAVEGSEYRAGIAALRCADLDSVSVVCADISTLSLPTESYDAVVFVGVLEYAGVYAPDGRSPVQQIQRILTSAINALRPDGFIVVAIENRLGLKYLAGAPEDHLSRAWIGIADYPRNPQTEGSGEQPGQHTRNNIRTLDQAGWRHLLDEVNLTYAFFYPLPDYKLPMACLSESLAETTDCNQLAWRYPPVSRAGQWSPAIPVRISQAGLALGASFGTFSDSFGIVAAPFGRTVIDEVLPYDYVDFLGASGSGTGLCKLRHEKQIRLFDENGHGDIHDEWIKGEPVEQHWLRVACSEGYPGIFSAMRQYLIDLRVLYDAEPVRYRSAELSPAKVLIDRQDGFRFPVRYNSTAVNPLPENCWKNAVVCFAAKIGPEVRRMIGPGEYENVADFVQNAYAAAGLVDGWNTLEMNPQSRVGFTRVSADDIMPAEEQLSTPWQESVPTHQVLRFQVYWSKTEEGYSEDASVWMQYDWESNPVLRLELPSDSIGLKYLRIDPVDHNVPGTARFAVLEEVVIEGKQTDGELVRLFRCDVIDEKSAVFVQDIQLGTLGSQQLFHFTGPDPQFRFSMDRFAKEAQRLPLVVTVKLRWPISL